MTDPRDDISTAGLPTAVAGAVTILKVALKSGGNNSVAWAAGQTLGELVSALTRSGIQTAALSGYSVTLP